MTPTAGRSGSSSSAAPGSSAATSPTGCSAAGARRASRSTTTSRRAGSGTSRTTRGRAPAVVRGQTSRTRRRSPLPWTGTTSSSTWRRTRTSRERRRADDRLPRRDTVLTQRRRGDARARARADPVRVGQRRVRRPRRRPRPPRTTGRCCPSRPTARASSPARRSSPLRVHVRPAGCAFRFGNVVGPRQTHGVGFDFVRRLLADPPARVCAFSATAASEVLHPRARRRARRADGPPSTAAPFDVYNVATGDYITVTEIADLAVECVGVAREPRRATTRAATAAGRATFRSCASHARIGPRLELRALDARRAARVDAVHDPRQRTTSESSRRSSRSSARAPSSSWARGSRLDRAWLDAVPPPHSARRSPPGSSTVFSSQLLRHPLRHAWRHEGRLPPHGSLAVVGVRVRDGPEVGAAEPARRRGPGALLQGPRRAAQPPQAFGLDSPWKAAWINLRAMFVYGADFFLYKPGVILLAVRAAHVRRWRSVPLTLGPIVILAALDAPRLSRIAVLGLQCVYMGICRSRSSPDYAGIVAGAGTTASKYTRTRRVQRVVVRPRRRPDGASSCRRIPRRHAHQRSRRRRRPTIWASRACSHDCGPS